MMENKIVAAKVRGNCNILLCKKMIFYSRQMILNSNDLKNWIVALIKVN
jgi:hypothetical protein